ncbi:hypothetical protein [Peribacillus sp. NPDC096540]|uniref:hypothetical protein n=1 Tax=Peribacillus sp. NPDC096540 TaxID=3390612 RepID=UPI003D041A17
MGIILIIIVAILAVTGLITFNIKALSPDENPVVEEEHSLGESAFPPEVDFSTEIIVQKDRDELKMKDDDYRLALSNLHNQLHSNDDSSEENNPTVRKMKDKEYRGTLEDFQQHGK